MEVIVRNEWGLGCYFNSFRSNSRGVAILFNNNFQYKVKNIKSDDNGNLLVLDIEIDDYCVTLINLYGSNNDVPNFYEEISNIINDLNTHTHYYLWRLEFNFRCSHGLR